MESNSELRAAKQQKTSSPNSRNQQYPVPGERFATSQLGKAKAGRHCKSIEDVLPYVSCSGVKHAKSMLQQRAESPLRFTWRGGPLLLLRLWLLVKGFVVLSLSARTESASSAVFSSLAAVCSLISGPGASSTGGSVLQVAAEDLEEAATPSPPKMAGDVNGGGGGSPPAGAATKHRTGCNGSVGGQDMLHELLFEVRAMQALFRQLQTQPLPAWFFSVNVDGTHSVCWQGLCSSTTQSTLQQWSTMLKVSEVRIDILDILKLTVLEAHCLRHSAM